MKQSINQLLIILVLIMAACTLPNIDSISEQVSEIQQNNIPDKRLLYWNVDVNTDNGKIVLSGATASEKAYSDLHEFAKIKSLNFDVELLPDANFKQSPWGIVCLSVCNIRGDGTHSAELLTQSLMGTPVKVYQKVDGWYLIQTPDRYFGWVDEAAIALKDNAELAEWKIFEKVLYNKQNGFAYVSSDENSAVECDLVLADLLSIIAAEKDFYQIIMADGRTGFVKKQDCTSLERWRAKMFSVEDVLSTAFNFKGVPYLWGGTSAKMVDCSGFTKSAYYMQGVILQRDASQQTLYGELVDTKNGYEKLQAGDLIFFGKKATEVNRERVTHVGLCIGNQEFIHASGKVRINSLNRESEKYTEYYETAFVRSRRIIGNTDGEGIEWAVDNAFYQQILPE